MGYSNIEIGKEGMQGSKVRFERPIEFEYDTKGLVFRAPKPEDILIAATDEHYAEMSGYHASEHVIIEGSKNGSNRRGITGSRWNISWFFRLGFSFTMEV